MQTTRFASSTLFYGWTSLLLTLLGALVGASALSYLIVFEKYRFAIASTVTFLLIALSVVNIRMSIIGAFVYLVFMGDLRRLLIPSVGWSGEDPLLLIGPVFALVVFAYAWSSQSIRVDSPLAAWMLALIGVMILQMFNPRQGGLIVGVAGALFYIIPLLWYWIGRTYATPSFVNQLLFYVVAPLAALSAAFGLFQIFYGFLPYQMDWYELGGASVVGAVGTEKPMSFFSSPTEHDNFVLSGLIVLIAALLHRRQYGLLLFILPLTAAIFLGGSRGPVAKLIVTATGLWAVLGTNKSTWIVRGGLALVLAVVGLSWSLSSIEVQESNERVEFRLERQRKGLTGATNENSSALNHLSMMAHGFKQGVTTPLGYGLGATTRAGAKYGGMSGSTEADSSDVFRSTGLVGGIIYLVILFLVIRSAVQYWGRTRSLLALCLAGVLAVNFFLWLRGGQYAVSPLIWFLIGALDRFQNRPSTDDSPPETSLPEAKAPAEQVSQPINTL